MEDPGRVSQAAPNPRGGALPGCEAALADALAALAGGADPLGPLTRAAHELRAAGWESAWCMADALVRAYPHAMAAERADAVAFGVALHAFQATLGRHDLFELANSPQLFEHFFRLRGMLPETREPAIGLLAELALAGRPVPAAYLHSMPSARRLAHIRAYYEQALLVVLQACAQVETALAGGPQHEVAEDGALQAALVRARQGLARLERCLAALIGTDPYDFWRLAAACLRVLGQARAAALAEPQVRWLCAHYNLLLRERAGAVASTASTSLVRGSLALLWREAGAPGMSFGEHETPAQVLLDYGLTLPVAAPGTPTATVAFDRENPANLPDATNIPGRAVPDRTPAAAAPQTRELGSLVIDALAYEDFLLIADAAIADLSDHTAAARTALTLEAGTALHAGAAAFRLGGAAAALGLGGVARLADALGLAWRRSAYRLAGDAGGPTGAVAQAGSGMPAGPGPALALATTRPALEHGADALRGMLHQIAAGMPPTLPLEQLAELGAFIER